MERRRYVRSNHAEVVGVVKPILFDAGETAFAGNGLGVLADAVSCIVTEERNGAFELEMEYPVNGIHYAELALRRIILAEPNAGAVAQPFRIYKISRPMGGVVAVSASHISYDLSGVPVSPFTATTAAEAFAGFSSHALIESPFTFASELATQGNFSVTVPTSIRSLLGGTDGSIIDVYGGEYEFNRFNVILRAARGQNRGVSIRYGKNLTSLEQDENCESVYTGVLGYWAGSDGGPLVVGEIAYAPGTYAVQRILVVDFTQDYETQPTSAQLTAAAASYVSRNKVGVPSVSLSVSFVPIGHSAEYADIAPLEQVDLCDTVNIEFPALGVSATAKCVKTVYNVLTGRLDSVDIGEARGNIAGTIAEQQQAIKDTPQQVLSEVGRITAMITGNTGGYVVLHIPEGETYPRELLMMDTPSIATAQNVWRWNLAGLGFSANGYNGPYTTAITQDGSIVADFITTGVLNASIIKAGVLQSVDGSFKMNLATGEITLTNDTGTTVLAFDASGNLTINGKLTAASGTFNQLTSTGSTPSIKFGSNVAIDESSIVVGTIQIENDAITFNQLVTVDENGMWIRGGPEESRFFMENPPTATGGTEARWVFRDDFGAYSLGRYTSARSAKKHITTIKPAEAWAAVGKLNPVRFRFRGQANNARRSMGFIADEMAAVCPELATYEAGEPAGVQYSNATALLTAALQEAERRIERLEAEMKEMKN